MDLRPLSPEERRQRIEQELGVDISAVQLNPDTIGAANEKNCENMFGQVPVPVGLAGPLPVNGRDAYLPLATTEGALVASVNRGCKAIRTAGGAVVRSVHHGISRSVCFNVQMLDDDSSQAANRMRQLIEDKAPDWYAVAEATSNHLKIAKYTVDVSHEYVFLTIYGHTGDAMGMNMITIAAQAVGAWLAEQSGAELITIAGNVDSDKKPSRRTHDTGRGYEVIAEVTLDAETIGSTLKTTPDTLLKVADAKLQHGSTLAGAIGANLHAANTIAALYLATGQDAAHVVEGSLTDTNVRMTPASRSFSEGWNNELRITVRCPAILVGTVGGGTQLPAQKQCLELIMQNAEYKMPNSQRLAEVIGGGVLAGELSLLAAQASHTLASAHKKLGR